MAAPRSSAGASDFQSLDSQSQGGLSTSSKGGSRKQYSRSAQRNELIHLQRSKNRIKDSARKMKLMQSASRKKSKLLGGVPRHLSERQEQLEELERREKALVEREGHLLQQKSLMLTN